MLYALRYERQSGTALSEFQETLFRLDVPEELRKARGF